MVPPKTIVAICELKRNDGWTDTIFLDGRGPSILMMPFPSTLPFLSKQNGSSFHETFAVPYNSPVGNYLKTPFPVVEYCKHKEAVP